MKRWSEKERAEVRAKVQANWERNEAWGDNGDFQNGASKILKAVTRALRRDIKAAMKRAGWNNLMTGDE